ncbi:BRO-N domain-containing protein [Xylocopilactobacillus apicola]|uniref:Bro-N domain-containing protein n=1 Tax=Xylocopilactobacillus apicola TaxID=2932184 RepID=A0AAU9DAX0_9LACO|nr:Bro-N domain-containing protein [Xylocopilactobacillus apicola]BDR59555.1 hypothetical protein XA3_19960 [Xylocopilactobacillus apicola]
MKIETWNGYKIRFVEVNGEWCAIAKDVTEALDYRDPNTALRKMPEKYKGAYKVRVSSQNPVIPGSRKYQIMTVITEKGLYRLIMRSNKPEAEDFQDWVFEVIKQLRKSSGLESYELFRLTDKKNQNELMATLKESLNEPTKVDYIKANAITNKAISNMFGHEKMIKKEDMTPEELAKRGEILKDVIDLMITNDKYDLGLSVSKTIYNSTEKPKSKVIYRHSVQEGARVNE